MNIYKNEGTISKTHLENKSKDLLNKTKSESEKSFYDKNGIFLFKGIFEKFATKTYPGRIYGMYKWDDVNEKWVLDKEFCKEHNIDIDK